MSRYIIGLSLSAALVVVIVLTNVIFPNNGPDEGWQLMAGYLLMFAVFAFSGFYARRQGGSLPSAAKAGATTAFIVFAVMMATYIVVDNVFLDIVSQQQDKIYGFTHSNYNDMRDYINSGNLRGVAFVLPIGTLLGAGFGLAGGFARRVISI
jgi:hypothetical protein